MSAGPEIITETRAHGRAQQGHELLEHIARLSDRGLPPNEYFGEFLGVLIPGISAICGVVWARSVEGRLQIQAQRNMPLEALVSTGAGPEALRLKSFDHTSPIISPDAGITADGAEPRPVVFVPVVIENRASRLVEVWFECGVASQVYSQAVPLATRAAALAAEYVHFSERQQLQTQQKIWAQLNSLVQTIHGTLNPTEIAYHVANEGRRLIGCDRCSVALRYGDRVRVEAISGLDIIDKRSNLVRTLRHLCDRVLAWGEPLEFFGEKDGSLPPSILEALDAYLAETSCRFLAILPLKDKREEEGEQPARTALAIECFDATSKPRKLLERVRVVGQHVASALFNATEYRAIPLRPLWVPLVWLRHGVGSTTRLVMAAVSAVLILLVAVLLWVPYPLKMDAKGQLLPETRAWIYAPVEGQVVKLAPGVAPGAQVGSNQSLILMYDVQLQIKIVQLQSEIAGAQRDIEALGAQADTATPAEQAALGSERKKREFALERKIAELRALCERTHAVEGRPGHFWLQSPIDGTVLSGDFQEGLVNRTVRPSEQLVRVGDKSGSWEIVLKIPQQHVGQVLLAFDSNEPQAELDVDLLLLSTPTQTFKGKLQRGKIGSEAAPPKDEPSDPEPVLIASVRIEGPDIDPGDQIPRSLLVAGTDVHAKIRCGNRRTGYSLFYGVWEFFYEKVVFFF